MLSPGGRLRDGDEAAVRQLLDRFEREAVPFLARLEDPNEVMRMLERDDCVFSSASVLDTGAFGSPFRGQLPDARARGVAPVAERFPQSLQRWTST